MGQCRTLPGYLGGVRSGTVVWGHVPSHMNSLSRLWACTPSSLSPETLSPRNSFRDRSFAHCEVTGLCALGRRLRCKVFILLAKCGPKRERFIHT